MKISKDSYGNQEKVIRRVIGKKVHSINEKKDSNGFSEREERFENFEDGKQKNVIK